MNPIKTLVARHKEKVAKRNHDCFSLIEQVTLAIDDLALLFSSPSFVDPEEETRWKKKNEDLIEDLKDNKVRKYKKANRYKALREKSALLISNADGLGKQIEKWNEKISLSLLPFAYEKIGKVEGRTLDEQQMKCIVKTAHNQLVIAGAGTGKSTTIIGKIKYLLLTKQCVPQDILVLSFTNASASEMKERVEKEVGEGVSVSTFHKLGLNILAKAEGVMPRITQLNMAKFIREQLQLNMESPQYLYLLSKYLLFNKISSKSEFDFSTEVEYEEYLRMNPPVTLNNESVKSYGELAIANFLAMNGVRYIYEQPYKIDTRTSHFGQYHPDFYLPDYDVYIEYYGVNRAGDVPSYFRGRGELSASEAYRDTITWKRYIHRTYGTELIECYAYEKQEGTLLDNLQNRLVDCGVHLEPLDASALWEQISSSDPNALESIISLFETVINLIKSNGYTIETVRSMNKGGRNARNNELILRLVEPIFGAYNAYLDEQNEIDFNDMIVRASKYVSQGKYANPFKYVIIDEYQDISKARYSLLSSLRKSRDFTLFCVGDDWQSIYRFAGSDIGYILDFPRYWGATAVSRIETTYRFNQSLSEISGDFVMENPAQIRKKLIGKAANNEFALGEINGSSERNAISLMVKKLDELPKGSTVFFIGRYSFDGKLLSDNSFLSCRYNNVSGFVEVKYRNRPDLQMSFLTAHRTKGLQADFVFIINNKNSRMGFPSKVQDDAILDLLLECRDDYPFAEERRLYYVALTRAKTKAFLVTVNGMESEFSMDLIRKFAHELDPELSFCPQCGGRLFKKSGPYGDFWGCSNYKRNGCKYKLRADNTQKGE